MLRGRAITDASPHPDLSKHQHGGKKRTPPHPLTTPTTQIFRSYICLVHERVLGAGWRFASRNPSQECWRALVNIWSLSFGRVIWGDGSVIPHLSSILGSPPPPRSSALLSRPRSSLQVSLIHDQEGGGGCWRDDRSGETTKFTSGMIPTCTDATMGSEPLRTRSGCRERRGSTGSIMSWINPLHGEVITVRETDYRRGP